MRRDFCFQDWPLAGLWALGWSAVPYTDVKLSEIITVHYSQDVCTNHKFMLTISFPYGSLGFWHKLSRGCLCDQLLINQSKQPQYTPQAWNLQWLSLNRQCIHVAVFLLLREKYALCKLLQEGEVSQEICMWIPSDSACFFPIIIQLHVLTTQTSLIFAITTLC